MLVYLTKHEVVNENLNTTSERKNLPLLHITIKLSGFISDNNFTLDILLHIVCKYNIFFVCFHWCVLNKESISLLHSRGIRVFYYTLKDKKMLTMLEKFNIDGIVSDIIF